MKIASLSSVTASQKRWGLIVFSGVFALLWALITLAMLEFSSTHRYYITFFMMTPGIAALVAAASIGLSGPAMGLKLAPARQVLESYGLPIVYGLVAYSIIWLFFSKGIGTQKGAEGLANWLGIIGWDMGPIFGFFIAMMLTVGVALQMVSTLGIELGFRGFLAPLLMPRLGFLGTAIFTGLLYAGMHVPLVLFGDYNAGPKALELQLAAFALTSICLAIMGLYYRLLTGSILPGALLHATHVAANFFAFSKITSWSDQSWLYVGEFGVALPVIMVPVALFFYAAAKKRGYTKPA